MSKITVTLLGSLKKNKKQEKLDQGKAFDNLGTFVTITDICYVQIL